jgi:hypothetical protein
MKWIEDNSLPVGIIGSENEARAQLLHFKNHYPFRKWICLEITHEGGMAWIYFSSRRKMNNWALKNNVTMLRTMEI